MPSSLIIDALVVAGESWAGSALGSGLITLGVRLAEAYAISSLINKNLDQPTSSSANTGGTVQLSPATQNKLPVVYGTHHVSPIVTDAMLSSDQQTMWFVLTLSEATSGAVTIGDVYWDDKLLVFNPANPSEITSWYVPASAGGAERNSRVTGVAGKISMWFYGNGSSQEITHQCLDESTFQFSQQKSNIDAISVLQDPAIPTDIQWTATDVMSATVFAVCKVVYDQAHQVTSLSGNIKVEIKNNLNQPGAVIYDYLTNPRYGCNIPVGNVNTDSLTALNTFSAQTHALRLTNGDYASGPRYEINGILDTAQDCMVNLNVLADSADSWIQWDEKNAKWGVVMNRSYEEAGLTTSTMVVVTKDQIIGGINVLPTDLKTSANKLTIQYPNYTLINQTDYRYYDLPDQYKSANEPNNNISVNFPFADNDLQATYLGYKKLWSTRADLVINFSMDYSGIRIDAGDIICVQHEWYGWNANSPYNGFTFPGKPFRVTQVKEAKDPSGFLSVMIAAIEYNHSVYTTTDPGFFELTEFNNNLLSDPNVISVPGKPTVGNINTSSGQTFFEVSSTVPNTTIINGIETAPGRVNAMEFWYSNTNTVTTNNFALYETQNFVVIDDNGSTTSKLYPPGATEKVIVTGLPAGTYWWTVRATGPESASPFSDLSDPFVWSVENATGSITGGSIADNSIPGSKVISGDPATTGQKSSGGFFDNLSNIALLGLGGAAAYYAYDQGWFSQVPKILWDGNGNPSDGTQLAGGGQGGGSENSTVTQDVQYADQNGDPVDYPRIGDTQIITVANNENYDSPSSYINSDDVA